MIRHVRLKGKDHCLHLKLTQILIGLSYGIIDKIRPAKNKDFNISYFYRSVGDPQHELKWGSFEYGRNTMIEVLFDCIEL